MAAGRGAPAALPDDAELLAILRADPRLASVLEDPERYRLQVLLTEVAPASDGYGDDDGAHSAPCEATTTTTTTRTTTTRATLRRRAYRADAEYFYPASAVKIYGAVVALFQLQLMASQGVAVVELDTPLAFESRTAPVAASNDAPPPKSAAAPPLGCSAPTTMRREISALFHVSDNEAFNRCYDVAGRTLMWEWANSESLNPPFRGPRILHRLFSEAKGTDDGGSFPGVWARVGRDGDEDAWRRVLCRRHDVCGHLVGDAKRESVGKAHVAADGTVVDEPLDCSARNRASLASLQDTLIRLTRPEFDESNFKLTETHRRFVLAAAAGSPRDSPDPSARDDAATFPNNYNKFFVDGVTRAVGGDGSRVRITNKCGQAFGFSVDNAFVEWIGGGEDEDENRNKNPFYLAAAIETNANGVVNDDVYEYADVAEPFMDALAETVARWVWREREK